MNEGRNTKRLREYAIWLGRHPVWTLVIFVGIIIVGNLIGGALGGFAGGLIRFGTILLATYLGIAFLSARWEMRR